MTRNATIVGVIVDVGIVTPMPARTVDVVVVGVVVCRRTSHTDEGIVGRHDPYEGWAAVCVFEAQILCRAVDVAVLHQVDALEVDGHVDFFTCVGVVAIQPNLVERGADLLGPHLVDEHVGGQLVLVAAVNHQFVLTVEACYGARCLAVGEIEDVVCCNCHCGHHQSQH